jgi:hypothetical protein
MVGADFLPETDAQLAERRAQVLLLIQTTDARNLTDAELLILVPSHAPRGHRQNRVRGRILIQLNAAGFTWQWKRLT